MEKKKWVTFGVAGAVGLTIVGGAAAATAANMNLQGNDGSVVPGGPVVGTNNGVLDRGGVQMRVTDTSASVVSAPTSTSASGISIASPVTPASPTSSLSVVSASTPVAPPAPAPPAPAPAPDSPASAASIGSVASAGSY
ncbi:hypothetical protein LG299_07405 [Microbacterium lacus]|uniref:hypothetical protein n=1 Tax=Microbacterium lacus TaxID=415217 RepID=UPI003850637D